MVIIIIIASLLTLPLSPGCSVPDRNSQVVSRCCFSVDDVVRHQVTVFSIICFVDSELAVIVARNEEAINAFVYVLVHNIQRLNKRSNASILIDLGPVKDAQFTSWKRACVSTWKTASEETGPFILVTPACKGKIIVLDRKLPLPVIQFSRLIVINRLQ